MRRTKYTPLDRECDRVLARRATGAVCVLLCAFSVVSGRIFFLQMRPQEGLVQKMATKRVKTDLLPAALGAIFDTKQRLLAADEPVQSVVFDNVYLNEKKSKGALERMAQALATTEHRPWVEIRRTWSETELTERYVWWLASLISPAVTIPTPIPLAKAGVAPEAGRPEPAIIIKINATPGPRPKSVNKM